MKVFLYAFNACIGIILERIDSVGRMGKGNQ
jgi:hypothetical protein